MQFQVKTELVQTIDTEKKKFKIEGDNDWNMDEDYDSSFVNDQEEEEEEKEDFDDLKEEMPKKKKKKKPKGQRTKQARERAKTDDVTSTDVKQVKEKGRKLTLEERQVILVVDSDEKATADSDSLSMA